MTRILLVDDHAVFRSGVRALLEREGDLVIAGEAGGADDALALLSRLEVDVVLLDLSLPGKGGAWFAERARRQHPRLALLVLTMHEDQSYLHQLFGIGALGYLLKKSSGSALVEAIRAVSRGQHYVDPALAGSLEADRVARTRPASAGGPEKLTAREREVARLLAWGHTNLEIAAKLNISDRTVETHRANVMSKLRLTTRADLVRFAVRHGLLDPA
jgi:two-component system response regulator NreC